MTALSIEMLPAAQGDALWLEWGDPDSPIRVLIDGGPGSTYPALRKRVEQLPPGDRRIDLIIVTHVDTDHIDGIVTLLLDDIPLQIGDIWFNGRGHAERPHCRAAGNRYLGGAQGQILTAILGLDRFPWNQAFGGKAVVVPDRGSDFPSYQLGGLNLTILSPGAQQLTRLARSWNTDVVKALRKMDLIPEGSTVDDVAEAIRAGGWDLARRLLASRYGKRINPPPEWDQGSDDKVFLGDASIPNGSSIAVLIEDEGRHLAVLLTGDAHDRVLNDSINRLLIGRGVRRLRLDAFKLPHHGSQHNMSTKLLRKLDCDRFLFSSDGSRGFNHPDDDAVDMILAVAAEQDRIPELHFNYVSDRTESWQETSRGNGQRYVAVYPPQGRGDHGLVTSVGRL